MRAILFIEGGGDAKDLRIRCREGFRKLLEASGFTERMPRTVACGGRGDAFSSFKTAHASAGPDDFVALLVDSEEPVADIEKPWAHLCRRDRWTRPSGVREEQALLMTTCMETWIAADRRALRGHYGSCLRESALPALTDMESRNRHAVQDALSTATRGCNNAYEKGKRSFIILGQLSPEEIRRHLPSFARILRVLGETL